MNMQFKFIYYIIFCDSLLDYSYYKIDTNLNINELLLYYL